MSDDLNELYQEVILDHSRKPRNFRVLPEATCSAEGHNPLCGDRFTVFLKLDQGVIQDISFQGSGCAISKASASMMTDQLKGKTVADAKSLFGKYQQMVTTGPAADESMGKLKVFEGVRNFPMRVKCAILPWHALMAGLKGEVKVSTEESKT
jgi:nitrogen fixation NifU-like protein